jgi:hypothetical protein
VSGIAVFLPESPFWRSMQLLRANRPEQAVNMAGRISAVMSPAMFLGLTLP